MALCKLGPIAGLRIAGASLADGLLGVLTLGFFIGDFRQRASLAAARRDMLRRDPQTFWHD